MNKSPLSPREIIDAFGGTSAVARLFNIRSPSVSEWKTNGIPDARMMCFRLLRPELFGQDKKAA